MTRLAVSAALLVASLASPAHAQEDAPVPADVQNAAEEAGVDPFDLLGAVNTTGLDARTYLIAVGELPDSPPLRAGWSARVRLTFYVEAGVTYGGGHTYMGSTACSWNFKIGQRFVLPDGEVVVCNDRGLLGGAPGWLDLFGRADLASRYGPYATVQVLP